MGAATTPARICPECGTRNSGLSLFCAECGASLTNATQATTDESQTTTVFRPASGPEPSADPYATQQFTPQATYPSGSTASSSISSYSWDDEPDLSTGYILSPENRRGLVLGWIAGILILLVIAWLGWTSFLDPNTRDSIISLVG